MFLSSGVAVEAFFVVSGFLIFMSCERSSSLASYAGKRFRRIYPAYFSVVMLCALGLFVLSSKDSGGYFSLAWFKYVVANLAFLNFLQPALPGVFEGNKLAVIDGPLWTLKVEVMFYLSVPLFVYLCRRCSRFSVLALTYCGSTLYAWLLTTAAQRSDSTIYLELARQLPGQLSYFMSGALLYYYLPLFERRTWQFIAPAILVLAIDLFVPLPFLEPLALAIIVIGCGVFFYLGNFGKYGDFSYGVYILHFPIIQVLLQMGWFKESPWYFLSAVILAVSGGAIAMWHLVEKRYLLRNSHYIATSSVPAEISRLK